MWKWILLISIPIIVFAIIEELIYFFVNRTIIRNTEKLEKIKLRERIRILSSKLKFKKRAEADS